MALEQKLSQQNNRKYRGYKDPLDYFLAHPEFEGVSRKELSKFDSGLYRSLLRYNQLELAIEDASKQHVKAGKLGGKHTTPPLTKLQIREVLRAHKPYKGNAGEAARHLPYSQRTFLKYWKKAKRRIRTRGERDY